MIGTSKAFLFALVAALLLPAHAENSAPATPIVSSPASGNGRWEQRLTEFAQADKTHMPPAGGVLFVGSSSIRRWENLEHQFNVAPVVIKRGIGGFRMDACATYLNRLVIQYKPRLVVIYAGENDLAEGRTPEQVLNSFVAFVDGVRAKLPDTRIAYISIKPSLAREKLLAQIRITNALIRSHVARMRNAEFIDVFTPMLDKKGVPRADLFSEDRLHMNAAGYAIWKAEIAPVLK